MNGTNGNRKSKTNRSDATIIDAMNENRKLQVEPSKAIIMTGIKCRLKDQRQ